MNIRITKRSDDWHACIAGRPQIWGCGDNPDAAVGDLIRSHCEVFHIIIEVTNPSPPGLSFGGHDPSPDNKERWDMSNEETH